MVWNRNQTDNPQMEPQPGPSPQPRSHRLASLGPSITINGNLSGEEDLVIEGQVEGEISLKKHSVTIGSSGRVKADIYSKSICVEGEVSGNLYGSEEVVIRKSGRVEGNAIAPRVTLENGAKFRGSIDMQPQATLNGANGGDAGTRAQANAKAKKSGPPGKARGTEERPPHTTKVAAAPHARS